MTFYKANLDIFYNKNMSMINTEVEFTIYIFVYLKTKKNIYR